jgi:hypothetical protein
MYKVEVIADSSSKWCGNGLRFDSKAEAEEYGRDLASRWMAVREWRVVQLCPHCNGGPSRHHGRFECGLPMREAS